jgi:predicted transcriptional regulator
LQVHDTWAVRDLPVLDATVALLEQSFMVTVTDIAARMDLAPSVVAAALEALDPVYVDFRKTTTGGDPRYWYVFKVTPEARRAVGQWPTAESLASRLAEELATAAREEPEAERQGLLTYAARLVGETLRDATVRAAGRVLAPAFGGIPVPELGMPVPESEPAPDDDYPSLVDLPELPELLRSRTAGARTVDAEPDEPDEPEVLHEPEAAPAVHSTAPEALQLEPLPDPPGAAAVAEPPTASGPSPDPDDITAH